MTIVESVTSVHDSCCSCYFCPMTLIAAVTPAQHVCYCCRYFFLIWTQLFLAVVIVPDPLYCYCYSQLRCASSGLSFIFSVEFVAMACAVEFAFVVVVVVVVVVVAAAAAAAAPPPVAASVAAPVAAHVFAAPLLSSR